MEKHEWYVVAKDVEPEPFTEVFGPFLSETDARAYAIDVDNDNGWATVEAMHISPEEAQARTSGTVRWPYKQPPEMVLSDGDDEDEG